MEVVTCDDVRFQVAIAGIRDALIADGRQGDAANIIEDEARRFLKKAVQLTPPKNKMQGEQAVEDDLKHVFTPADADFLLYEFGGSRGNVDQWFTNKKGEKVHAQFEALDIHGAGMKKFHAMQRNARGRTMRGLSRGNKTGELWKARYVVSYDALADYARKIKARVGMRKSGWLRSYNELGGKLPSWIQRQISRALGGVVNNLGVKGKPSILMSSHAPGAKDDQRMLAAVLRSRAVAIERRFRLIMNHYAWDIKSGGGVKRHATRTED